MIKKIELCYSNWTQLNGGQTDSKHTTIPPTTVHLHGSQEPLLIAAKRVNVSSGHSGDLGIHSALQHCWTQHPTPSKPTHNNLSSLGQICKWCSKWCSIRGYQTPKRILCFGQCNCVIHPIILRFLWQKWQFYLYCAVCCTNTSVSSTCGPINRVKAT